MVHHTGKDNREATGSYSLPAATEAIPSMSREGMGMPVEAAKQKHSEDGRTGMRSGLGPRR